MADVTLPWSYVNLREIKLYGSVCKWKNRSRFSHLFDIKHRILPDFYLCASSIVIIIFKLKYRLHCFNTIQINDEQNHIKMNVLYYCERFVFFPIIFWSFAIESLSLNIKMRLLCTVYTQRGTVCMHLLFDDNIFLFIPFWFHSVAFGSCAHSLWFPSHLSNENINEEISNLFAYDISRVCVLFIYTLFNCVPLNNGLIF